MLAEKRTATNIGVGAGIALEIVAVALVVSGRPLLSLLALPVLLASAVFFAWGCWSYAAGKGYPGVLGLLGMFFGFIGLLIMIVLPDKCRDGRAPTVAAAYPAASSSVRTMSPAHGTFPEGASPGFSSEGAYGAGLGAAARGDSGNGRRSKAAERPPMGGDGAAGWEEGNSPFAVPQIVAPTVAVAPAATATAAAEGDDEPTFESHPYYGPPDSREELVLPSGVPLCGDEPKPMRRPTPPPNHWSVRTSA